MEPSYGCLNAAQTAALGGDGMTILEADDSALLLGVIILGWYENPLRNARGRGNALLGPAVGRGATAGEAHLVDRAWIPYLLQSDLGDGFPETYFCFAFQAKL